MQNSAQIMKPGDVSLGLSHHFIGGFGRAGGTAKMLQEAADDPALMGRLVALFGGDVQKCTSVLRHLGTITVPHASESELEKFTFETREGLWVEEAFATIFGMKVSSAGASIELGRHQLTKDASDSAITAELQPGYIFKGEAGKKKLKHVIASLILAQWGGVEGVLLNNGYANIFYVELEDGRRLAVYVYWFSNDRKWDVYVWEFDGAQWGAEHVVFSCN